MNDVMIDLETLGQEAGAVITSISAVKFNIITGETGEEFSQAITLKSSLEYGLSIDPDTVMWWMQQGDDSRNKLVLDNANAKHLSSVLYAFAFWLVEGDKSGGGVKLINDNIQVWGRGPRFECALLSAAYKVGGYNRTPWNFRNERCVRTIEMFNPKLKKNTPFIGILHNGIDDAKHQIKYVSSIYRQLIN